MKKLLILILLLSFSSVALAATFEQGGECIIALNGTIDNRTPSDLSKFYTLVNNSTAKGCNMMMLTLDSNGGDVVAAMEAGTFVREKKMATTVRPKSCASACVLLYVGGVRRFGFSFGLHRPYSIKLSMNQSEAKNQYEQINNSIRQYLTRMNIPERLLDIMNSTSPDKVKWIDRDNNEDLIEELHLVGEDPIYAEEQDSQYAKSLKISKKEFYERRARSEDICKPILYRSYPNVTKADGDAYNACNNDIMHGRR